MIPFWYPDFKTDVWGKKKVQRVQERGAKKSRDPEKKLFRETCLGWSKRREK